MSEAVAWVVLRKEWPEKKWEVVGDSYSLEEALYWAEGFRRFHAQRFNPNPDVVYAAGCVTLVDGEQPCP